MLSKFELSKLKRFRRALNRLQIRGACRNAYLGDHTSLAFVLGRFSMYLDTRDIAFAPHMLADGYWEIWHTEAMAKLVKPGMKAVDLGANLGYFTLVMSELVGSTGQVHAFEPNPHIAKLLRNTVEINNFSTRTNVHQMALSDKQGEVIFYVDPARPMNATLIPQQGHQEVSVPAKRFDDLPDLEDADFIKIDVEGAEEAVWAGMIRRLDDPRPLTVIMEFTVDRYPDAEAFLDTFARQGFGLEYIDLWKGIVSTDKDFVLSQPGGQDQLLLLRR